ncbi:uracil nucleotide/cysteinyl leukotriene receptor-like [Silurus asotus]|uniref:Uracil nucleotide/cysteinyl leukotriene receptor-like n=1 Tax=Silurus asotus TaxID=30991 RepID=A0AAD5ADV7_SILAS|nr:uracil nucleotide/cysteinyl leukotriene receptor-like [Silurus asotus]
MISSTNTTTNSYCSSVESWSYISFIISMHTLNYLLGLPLNSYVMLVLFAGGRRLDPCDVFTVNQAAAEIFFLLMAPFHLALNFVCEMWLYPVLGLILGTGMSVRAMLQCCVCLERYLAIVHPITYLRFRPLRYRVTLCVIAWTISLACGVVCMRTFPFIPNQVFSVFYFVFMSGSIFACMSIRSALRHPGPGEGNADRATDGRAKKRAYHVVLVNLLTFLVQNTPIAVVFGALSTLPNPFYRNATAVCLIINLMPSIARVHVVFVLEKLENSGNDAM